MGSGKGSEAGILIIDDENNMLKAVSMFLESCDFRHVFTARDGFDGLVCIANQTRKINVILLDYMMPLMDGLEFIEELTRITTAKMAIIMITGYGRKECENRFYALENENVKAFRFFRKPFDCDELILAINEALSAVDQCT